MSLERERPAFVQQRFPGERPSVTVQRNVRLNRENYSKFAEVVGKAPADILNSALLALGQYALQVLPDRRFSYPDRVARLVSFMNTGVKFAISLKKPWHFVEPNRPPNGLEWEDLEIFWILLGYFPTALYRGRPDLAISALGIIGNIMKMDNKYVIEKHVPLFSRARIFFSDRRRPEDLRLNDVNLLDANMKGKRYFWNEWEQKYLAEK